jgi:hypothetical protein
LKLTESEIKEIVQSEQQNAIDYQSEISEKRSKLMDYYNCQPFGDEIEGQSKAVSSDVSDVVETLMPGIVRVFTQGRLIGIFEADREDAEQEAKDKTELSNHVFLKENNGFMTLTNMFKDALLQFTGTVKIYWDETEESFTTKYKGLSELEYQKLLADETVDSVGEVEEVETDQGIVYNCEEVKVTKKGRIRYDNIPPEEFYISKQDRDFEKPRFIGHRTPKTRSELVAMGFDRDVVANLSPDEFFDQSEEKNSRFRDYGNWNDSNPTNHSPNDTIYLGEYYLSMDVNGDGITEYWQVFYASDTLLEYTEVEDHPFGVVVPTPIPHRAIGTCPAEQVADIQYRKSHLVRNMLDNVYQTNYPRVMHSNKVDLDDLLTPRAGGGIEIDTDMADVGGHAVPLVIPNMIGDILQSIEYTDMERETRTGVTRYSQGLNSEALNKTATGFTGMMDASQQREYLIARVFAETGVKQIFEKTVALLAKYQDTSMQIKVSGKPLEVDPRDWGENTRCTIMVGLGAGDRNEKIMNLNNVLQHQMNFMANGLVLSDQAKIFKTLEKLVDEVGLKDASVYYNNPEIPEETLFAQNQQLQQMVQQLEQQAQSNPLAEAELIKVQGNIATDQMKEQNKMKQFIMKMAQDDKQFAADLAKDLTDMELKYETDIEGSII